jgi:flagellin
MFASTVNTTTVVYGTNVKTSSAALTLESAVALAAGSGGKFTVAAAAAATALGITGPNGGNTTVATTSKSESAASLATAINNVSGTTGVQAQDFTVTLALGTAGATNGTYTFNIQAGTGTGTTNSSGIGTLQKINASSAAGIVAQINGQSSTSGISASVNTAGQIVLTRAAGQNINISGTSSGSLKTVGTTPSVITKGAGTASAVIQGQVQFQSSGAFTLANATNVGLNGKSTLSSLSAINVRTAAGANSAINVVKYALASLNNQGGELGAVQQSVTANINNLNTSSQNLTTALGMVQDANIPAVSNSLTEAEIQAQSGVAALKSSTQLQQSYLSLLP